MNISDNGSNSADKGEKSGAQMDGRRSLSAQVGGSATKSPSEVHVVNLEDEEVVNIDDETPEPVESTSTGTGSSNLLRSHPYLKGISAPLDGDRGGVGVGGPILSSRTNNIRNSIILNNALQSKHDIFPKPGALPHLYRNYIPSKFCKRCGLGNSVVVFDAKSGSEICTRCGVVVEDRVINDEQEWRSFSNDGSDGNSKSRTGSVNDIWLDDVTNSQLLVGDKNLMKTMLRHNISESGDRLMKESFVQLRQIANSFCLHDNIVERCKEIMKEQCKLNILKASTKNTMAIVYVACREEGVFRTVKELITYDRTLSERELVKAINNLMKVLPKRNTYLSSSAAELMPRFCHYLQLSHEIVGVAEHVCRTAEQYINRSHRPNSLAAGSIFFVCNLCEIKVEMKSIAVAAKSSEATVRGIFRELLIVGDKLLPKDFKPKLAGGIEALRARSKLYN